jgi:hypothetical protein
MRLLRKLLMKLVMFVLTVLLMGSGVRYGQKYLMKGMGVPEIPGIPGSGELAAGAKPQFSSEETDLMSTVFKSALRLFSGQAKRDELASELSDKLYGSRADEGTMSELGIELVKPGGASPLDPGGASGAPAGKAGGSPSATAQKSGSKGSPGMGRPQGSNNLANAPSAAKASAKPADPAKSSNAMLDKLIAQAKVHRIELILGPAVLLGMVFLGRRGKSSPMDEMILPDVLSAIPTDAEPYTMQHAVHGIKPEDFELLVALIYQRQGYRVSLPAALGGGREGNFMLQRKAEKLLVVCKRLNQDHKVPVERLRELHEAVSAAGATRGLYVASCGFSWDARNFAKAKGLTAINARTLDELIKAAKERPDEDLLAVADWAPRFMSKVELKTPLCPTCEATMVQHSVSDGSVWVCSQRPECKGRRSGRTYQKLTKAPAPREELVAA